MMYLKLESSESVSINHMDVASVKKPKQISQRGSVRPIRKPTTGIISMIMMPPGEMTKPANSAV